MAQGDVERADAAADGGGHRAFDGYGVFFQGFEGFFGQPDVVAVDFGGFLAGVDFHPVDFSLAAVGFGHRRVDHVFHYRRDVHTDAVALDKGNNWIVRHGLAGNDFGTCSGDFDMGHLRVS